jgi:hypothetical protein
MWIQGEDHTAMPPSQGDRECFVPSVETPARNLRFSIIIANYNYERYVGAAIESALALDWPDVEVIVVDDGSTDRSRERIAAFGNRIKVVFQANAGQRAANNAGFARSTGDIVVFLDADDLVDGGLAREVAAVWGPGISKVQVQMARIDAEGRPLGSVLPRLEESPTPAQIRRWMLSSVEYPTPPGSGNAYARSFLEAIFPVEKDRDSFTDTTCVAMAPFYGDVMTVLQPLVYYRMHGENDSSLLRDERHFGREIVRALTRLKASRDAGQARGLAAPEHSALFRGKHLLQLRIASLRLRPADHPLAGDSRARAFVDALLAPFRPGFESPRHRTAIAAWSLLAVLAPQQWARRLIVWRFSQRQAQPEGSIR